MSDRNRTIRIGLRWLVAMCTVLGAVLAVVSLRLNDVSHDDITTRLPDLVQEGFDRATTFVLREFDQRLSVAKANARAGSGDYEDYLRTATARNDVAALTSFFGADEEYERAVLALYEHELLLVRRVH